MVVWQQLLHHNKQRPRLFQQTGWIFWEGNSNQLWQDVGCDGHGVSQKNNQLVVAVARRGV